ncbi:MAG: hypothetical protein QXL67_00570 [Candidatus Bathyarchaeia archaeon]
MERKRSKALVMFSGGLDSMLAVKLVLEQGVEVEAVNFTTPFYLCDERSVDRFCRETGIRVHKVFLGQDFLDVVTNPTHGYGGQMNPCIDCRILMFRKAWELAKKIGADFLVTGEVLDERPFSQRRGAILLIEREAGLEGKILRPLSAKLLPESEPEKRRLIDRDRLLAIRGRRRLPQMELAKRFGIKNYPSPSGGCLLTDPQFARRLKEHLKHEEKLTLRDATLLKVGRHFRLSMVKVIVGRNEEENEMLLAVAKTYGIPYLEVINYKGPVTLYIGGEEPGLIDKAAAITVRYSDAPRGHQVKVVIRNSKERALEVKAMEDEELEGLRV